MLDSDGETSGALGKRAERCQPDYETMIKGIKDKLDKATAFRDAALAYFDGSKARDKMAELIGELVTDCARLQKQHDALITQQENDPEP